MSTRSTLATLAALVLALGLVSTAHATPAVQITRAPIAGDIAHYTFVVRVGSTPNAFVHIHRVVRERAPFWPRTTVAGIMLTHGDFATFTTNFALTPAGLAPYLAARDIDVWGFDRRAYDAPPVADTSDFADMSYQQGIDDAELALGIARAVRLATGSGGDRLIFGGFSRGAQLAYSVAAADAARPALRQNVKGLLPIDAYAVIPPEDTQAKRFACNSAAGEADALAAGFVDVDNGFIIELGQLAADDPDGPSPPDFFPGLTNRQAVLTFVGQTYFFYRAAPNYHLAGVTVDADDIPTGLSFSPEPLIDDWLISAAPHQGMRESAEADALWCGDVSAELATITVPLFYVGAAGGFGDHGLYTTTLVGSTDVQTLVVRRLPAAEEVGDFGHADLLFGSDAPALAWAPMAAWIRDHR